jgi:hypothetical protein
VICRSSSRLRVAAAAAEGVVAESVAAAGVTVDGVAAAGVAVDGAGPVMVGLLGWRPPAPAATRGAAEDTMVRVAVAATTTRIVRCRTSMQYARLRNWLGSPDGR